MSGSEVILEAIKARRETRDRIMLQNLLPILDQLRKTVDTQIDGEFKDLEDEISHVHDFALRDSASERINKFRIEVERIRNDQLPKALKELDELIECIQQQKFESAEEATKILKDKTAPIISVVFNLSGARERLDGMADMIIELPSPQDYRNSNGKQKRICIRIRIYG